MSFIPTGLIQKMTRDPTFADTPESTVRVNLERRMKEIAETYATHGHKQVWQALDRYALHGLVISYTLEKSQEECAFKDIQTFEIHSHGLDEEVLSVLTALDNHLWAALTCDKRSEFKYHCSAMRHAVHEKESAESFAVQVIAKFRQPSTLEPGEDFVSAFVHGIWVRLNDIYDGDRLTSFLQRVPEIEHRLVSTTTTK